jgi:hypothetical protein
MAQVAEHLTNKCEALSSKPQYRQKGKEKRKGAAVAWLSSDCRTIAAAPTFRLDLSKSHW